MVLLMSFSDKIIIKDHLNKTNEIKKKQSPFVKTTFDVYDQFGNLLQSTENQTVLGGAINVLQECWGVLSPLQISSINDILGIATDGVVTGPHKVCLFGVGIGGSGEGIGTVVEPKFYEREIVDMVPLRVALPESLTTEEVDKYWLKEDNGDGKVKYYLKKFEIEPEIKILWKDGVDDEDGTEVQTGVHNTTRTEPIETFVEMILKITKKDIREWFEINGEIELARFNSIGIFTGALGTLGDNSEDYKNVKLFSKININNEMLNYAKELTMVYRVYSS